MENSAQKVERHGYIINKDGTVLGKNGKILSNLKRQNGYVFVHMYIDGKLKSFNIHRLVAEKYLPKVEGKIYVNHKDGCKINNCVENLEWCTTSENHKHAFSTGLRKARKKAVIAYSISDTSFGLVYPSVTETAKDGFCSKCVSSVCNLRNKSHSCFRWEFLNA